MGRRSPGYIDNACARPARDAHPQGRAAKPSGEARSRVWRRGPGSNRRIKVLQTSPLPLGYRAACGSLGSSPVPERRFWRSVWSGRRDLNPRPSPWQGDALPLSYSRSGTSQSLCGAATPGQPGPAKWPREALPASPDCGSGSPEVRMAQSPSAGAPICTLLRKAIVSLCITK